MSISRRSLLANAATLGLTASGLMGVQPALAQTNLKGKQLRVATYGGSWRDAMVQSITGPLAAEGAQIDYVLGNPDDNLAKLIAAKRQGQIPFDVMDGSLLTYGDAYKAGLFEKIDFAALAGANSVPGWARADGYVIYSWAPEGIIYNEDKFKEAGIARPQSYLDLRNPKLKGRVAFPAPVHVHHWAPVVGLAMAGGGDETNLRPAIPYIKEIAPVYFYTSSVEVSTRFGSGDIWAAPWGAGWAVRMKRAGSPIGVGYHSFGSHKGSMWPGPLSITKGSPNLDVAMAYLAQWLTVDGPAAFCAATGVLPVSAAARAKFAELDALSRSMLLWKDNEIDNSFRVDFAKLDGKQWRDIWNREVQS
jgi:putative spermidine/putrescine transport system substrate-binding protein